jgi:hypothetical protein
VLSGEFAVVNKYLLKDLDKLGLWPKLKNELIAANGSVQVRTATAGPSTSILLASPGRMYGFFCCCLSLL